MSDVASNSMMTGSARERLQMALAARRYYIEDRSKVQIADELGLSRFKVARLLEQARSAGVVTITVDDAGTPAPELAERLERHLGLGRALVVEAAATPEGVRAAVGGAAARLLGQTLVGREVLGLGWGRTLAAMSAALPPLPRMTVVQLAGATGRTIDDSPVEILRQVALRSGGITYPFFAPLLVEDARTAEALKRQPSVSDAFAQFDHLTTAVVSVGAWEPSNSQLRTLIGPDEQRRLAELGVRGEVAASLFGDDGRELAHDIADRIVAVSGEQLRRVPRIIAAAGGADKARAVAAAVQARLCTELVTDRSLAEAVLELPPVAGSR